MPGNSRSHHNWVCAAKMSKPTSSVQKYGKQKQAYIAQNASTTSVRGPADCPCIDISNPMASNHKRKTFVTISPIYLGAQIPN